jgi:hypothetical protein
VYRSSIAGTLEYIRLKEVCKVQLTSYESVTNKYGFIQYDQLQIKRGPQGNYGLQFLTPGTVNGNTVKSDEYTFFQQSNLSALIVHY